MAATPTGRRLFRLDRVIAAAPTGVAAERPPAFDPAGAWQETAAAVDALLDSAPDYATVVATRDHHVDPGPHFSSTPDFVDSWPPHCVVGTPGVELHDALAGRGFDAVFDKGEYTAAYSGFEGRSADGSTLADFLRERGVDRVEVCGIATDHCVRATALDAAAAGFTTTVLLDLTAAVSPERLDATLEQLSAAGVQVR